MKTSPKKRIQSKSKRGGQLDRLIQEERALSKRLDTVQGRIFKLNQKKISEQEFNQLLDDLSAGLPELPPLPADFSRADLYDDHD